MLRPELEKPRKVRGKSCRAKATTSRDHQGQPHRPGFRGPGDGPMAIQVAGNILMAQQPSLVSGVNSWSTNVLAHGLPMSVSQ